MVLRCEAPAKINRELRVGPRRPDGYHSILSRFSSLDLADRLEAEPADGLYFSTRGEPSPSDASNLVLRAARALAEKLGVVARARLTLTKAIPAGAGLGGGSSDAASALRLLASLWKANLASQDLEALAARLGSDVPFFLIGGEADVGGRGEQVQPRKDIPSSEIWLLIPPFSLSTAQVYGLYDQMAGKSSSEAPTRLEIETSGRMFGPNDLAGAVLEANPRMAMYLSAARTVASEVTITGSGSAIAISGVHTDPSDLARRHPEVRLLACRTSSRDDFRRRTLPSGG
jgi:4-diphosphocytidyl-2-C-methyl-D-erythritol kinase